MKYCARCIMPETYPGISFNSKGICNYCLDYKPFHKNLGKKKLLEVLQSREKTGQYHCVVPISGGKDSTFILYYIVRELGLNPLAISYDSGYQSEFSKENVKNSCEILGVPLVVTKSPGNIQTNLLKESILVSKKLGRIVRSCGNCEAIIRTMSINTAKTYEVPFVIWGSSALESVDSEDYTDYKNYGKVPLFFTMLKKFNVMIKNNPNIIQRMPYIGYHLAKYSFLSISQKQSLNFPAKHALSPFGIPPFSDENPEFVHFYDYIPWDSLRNVKLLEDELGWKHPVGRDSRFDCTLFCLVNIQHLNLYGITQDGISCCNVIRQGGMEREEAVKRETEAIGSVENDCTELLDKLGFKNLKLP